ncbi:unnamed protein product [Peniophora sp. CBMAI 1063]|nr:unnamed protein product [Peniophora sp. CBMAI 1063]
MPDNASDAEPGSQLSWRLPVEVLTLVFAELQRQWRADPAGPRGGLGMIEVSQVSRFWRSVALSNSLWSSGVEAPRLPAPWTPLIIERADDVPLDLQFSLVTNDYADEALWLWLSHYASIRMRSLDFTCEGYEASRCVARQLKLFLPNLRHLRLHALLDPEPLYDDEATPKKEVFVLSSLRGAPELRTVDLLNFVLPWTPDIFLNVTNLKIVLDTYLQPDEYWRPPKLGAFKKTLEAMANLEVLHLGDVFPDYAGRTPDTKIVLSQSCHSVTVQNLYSYEDCATFLSSLVIPEGASVTLIVRGGPELLELADRCSLYIRRPRAARFIFAPENEEAGAVTLSPDIPTSPTTPMCASPSSEATRTFTLRARLARDFLVGVSRYGMDPAEEHEEKAAALDEVVEAVSDPAQLHLGELAHLHIHAIATTAGDGVKELLRQATNVRTLVIGPGAIDVLLGTLCPLGNGPVGDAKETVNPGDRLVLPSLSHIVIDARTKDLRDKPDWLQRLTNLVKVRQARVGTLTLHLPGDMAAENEISSLEPILQPSYYEAVSVSVSEVQG